jgi:signal transduction histidine kinase
MKLNVRDLEIPESADLISDRLLEAREKGFNVIETAHRAKDGRIIPVEISCRSILYNKKPAILTIARDITERKKSERLKEKFTEHLEREVKNRTRDLKELLEKQRLYLDQIEKSSRFKTEFLATMSHELRTPLNAIIGFTDLLIEGVFGELNKEQSEYINDIDDSSNHLLDMITRILDISKIESGQATLKIEEIQLNNLIAQVISTLKPLYIEKDIKWELVGLKKAQFIFADRIKFKQIIYNLLSNAIKFTKKGKIIFEFKENKYDWEFAIKDTGIGISENDFDIIFKDFKRVKSEYVEATQGIGLGLALTKRLVNLQGGDISFSSKLKKGTTFTFNLPKTIKKKLANLSKIESFLNKL